MSVSLQADYLIAVGDINSVPQSQGFFMPEYSGY
jgi:hypothetical protein